MQPQEPQAPIQQNSGQGTNDLRSSLGFITEMHKQLIQHKSGQTASVAPKTAPQQAEGSKPEEGAEDKKLGDLETKMDSKMEILRTEMKDGLKTEMDSVRTMIKDALNDQEN